MNRLITVLAALGVLVFSTDAALEMVSTSEDIPERGPVLHLLLKSSAGNFAINPPVGWSMAVDKTEETLIFELEKDNAVLKLKFSTNAPLGSREIKLWIDKHFPSAEILEEFHTVTRDSRGDALEFVYASAASTLYRTRAAFLPSERGHIALELSAPDSWPPRLHNSWTALVNSLQALPDSSHRAFLK